MATISLNGLVTPISNLGFVQVEVSFPDYALASHLSETIGLNIVAFDTIEISIMPYPSSTNDFEVVDAWNLELIQCTGTYQRAEIEATGTLTNGATRSNFPLFCFGCLNDN